LGGQFVVDRGAHAERGVAAVVVVVLDPVDHCPPGLGEGVELLEPTLNARPWLWWWELGSLWLVGIGLVVV
jgi:hypothetical protein